MSEYKITLNDDLGNKVWEGTITDWTYIGAIQKAADALEAAFNEKEKNA